MPLSKRRRTTDADLVTAAIRNAQHYKFAEGSEEKQCGTITYNFLDDSVTQIANYQIWRTLSAKCQSIDNQDY
jgi:hypothetical protein